MDRVKTSIKKYWNWRSESYTREYTSEIMNEKWESILKTLAPVSPGKVALDIGTGSGIFATCLSRAGFKVTAVDISEKMLSQAKQFARSQGLDIRFELGDAEDLDFADNSFDIVVSRNLLWTLPDPERALREWWRVMKPGATLIISDGFWMNFTWKRFHRLIFQLLNRLIHWDNIALPIRFFYRYAGLQDALPYYEGIRFEEVRMLLKDSGYKDITRFDPKCFDGNPYSGKSKIKDVAPSFFVACATR